MKLPFVISIAAVSGGGKTTVVKHLSANLERTRVLYFDDYDLHGPEDILTWVDAGADYNEWDMTPFVRDFNRLLKEDLHFIILDYPFAYKNAQVSKLIDMTVFIDTPLDIALARRILRDFSNDSASDILGDLQFYVTHGRRGYEAMLRQVRADSDSIIDGSLPISEISSAILQKIPY